MKAAITLLAATDLDVPTQDFSINLGKTPAALPPSGFIMTLQPG